MFSCDVGGWFGYGIILSQFVKSKVVFGFDEDESRPLFGQTSGFGSRSFHDVWGTMKKPASAKASAAGRSKWCVPCSLFLCLWKSFCVFSREIESQSSQSHFAQRHWRFYGVKEPSSTVAQVPDFPCVDRTLERSIQTVQRTTRHHTPTRHLTWQNQLRLFVVRWKKTGRCFQCPWQLTEPRRTIAGCFPFEGVGSIAAT